MYGPAFHGSENPFSSKTAFEGDQRGEKSQAKNLTWEKMEANLDLNLNKRKNKTRKLPETRVNLKKEGSNYIYKISNSSNWNWQMNLLIENFSLPRPPTTFRHQERHQPSRDLNLQSYCVGTVGQPRRSVVRLDRCPWVGWDVFHLENLGISLKFLEGKLDTLLGKNPSCSLKISKKPVVDPMSKLPIVYGG